MDIQAIKDRRSVRTYEDSPLDETTKGKIEEFIQDIDNLFGVPVDFRFLDARSQNLSSKVIVGASAYVAAKVRRCARAEEAFGYSFEKFVLYATSLGLGTVWLAGTLDREAFERALGVEEGEIMPAASPIGVPAGKMSMREALMRKSLKADERRAFDELFFKADFDHPLTPEAAGIWRVPLEMVRSAPSAANRQPWRIVVSDGEVHFYECKSLGRSHEAMGDIQKVDLGIALCHFEIAATEEGVSGSLVESDPHLSAPDNCEYIVSYRRNG